MTLIQLNVNNDELQKIEDLKPIVKSKARTKVLLFCLQKTHEFMLKKK